MRTVMIGTPAYNGLLTVPYVQSVIGTIGALASVGVTAIPMWLSKESLIPRARNSLVSHFRRSKADVLFQIDADLSFTPNDALPVLGAVLAHGADVAGCVYPMKTLPPKFAWWPTEGEPEYRTFGNREFVKVRSLPTGFLATTRRVFDELETAHPELAYSSCGAIAGAASAGHAFFDSSIENGVYYPEDFTFGARCRKIGIPSWALVGSALVHHGPHEFSATFNPRETAR